MEKTLHTRSPVLDQMRDQMHEELHDLCQPLTALQCVLELGRMQRRESAPGEDALLECVNGALEETQRIFAVIERIRQRLLAEDSRQNKGSSNT